MTKTLVRATGGVAADSSHSWTVTAGAMSAAAEVSVTDGGSYWQMDNTLTAVRIPKTISISNPPVFQPRDPIEDSALIYAPGQVLGPIQGIRHRDGTWTGTGPNYLYGYQVYSSPDGPPNWNIQEQKITNFPATSATVQVLETGPLRAKIRVTMSALRGAFGAPWVFTPDAYFICTISLQAGQPVIYVMQESDCFPSWWIDMNTGVSADRGRYKGHAASSIAEGHKYDGTLYEVNTEWPDRTEAERNFSDSGTRGTSFDYQTSWDGVYYGSIYHWYTWWYNTGWYHYAYNSAGGANSNIWGVFQGRAVDTQGGIYKGVSLYGKPATWPSTEFGFHTFMQATGWDSKEIHRRFPFAIYLGVKGTDVPVDFSAMTQLPNGLGGIQTYPSAIEKPLNIYSGTSQLWKQLDQGLIFSEPIGGWPGMHLDRTDVEALIVLVASDQGPGSYYSKLYTEDVYYRDIWDAFADETNQQAVTVLNWCTTRIHEMIDIYVNQGDIFLPTAAYWNGALRYQELMVRANAMLSLDQLRPFMTADQRTKLKAAMAMSGHILWDNDFVPMDNSEGFNMGTANMPLQYAGARWQMACVLKDHPQFIAKFNSILGGVTWVLDTGLNAYGAPRDCPHYAGAITTPNLDVLRQLQIGGYHDAFAPGGYLTDRLTGLGEWLMQISSPPQYRFGGLRKNVVYGDGSAEGSNNMIELIMGFEDHNLTLSKRLAGMWTAMGSFIGSFYASSGLKIKPNFPTQDPALGDADFPGSMTIMRSSWGTTNESAVFLLHGDDNVDHSTYQRGSPSIYLLGAPVSVSFGSMYSPHLVHPWMSMASSYVPVSELNDVWTASNQDMTCGVHSDYFGDSYTYTPTTNRVDLTCNFEVSGWIRHLTYYRDVLTCPVVRLRDSDTATGDTIFSLFNMADGAVTKPDGSTMTPTTLGGTPFSINNGACFQFVGQWGVSWDVYYFGPTAEAYIGMFSHTWAPSTEAGQYYEATGETFEEKQYLLRVKTAGPCDVVMVPYLTGQRPPGLTCVQVSGGLQINPGARFLAD